MQRGTIFQVVRGDEGEHLLTYRTPPVESLQGFLFNAARMIQDYIGQDIRYDDLSLCWDEYFVEYCGVWNINTFVFKVWNNEEWDWHYVSCPDRDNKGRFKK